MIMTRFDLAYTAITQFIVAKVNRFLLSSPWFWSRRKLRSLVSQCYLHSLIEYTDVVVVLDNEAICSSIINTNRIIAQAISSLTTSLHFDESRMQTWKARLNLDSSSSFCGDRRHHMRYIFSAFLRFCDCSTYSNPDKFLFVEVLERPFVLTASGSLIGQGNNWDRWWRCSIVALCWWSGNFATLLASCSITTGKWSSGFSKASG